MKKSLFLFITLLGFNLGNMLCMMSQEHIPFLHAQLFMNMSYQDFDEVKNCATKLQKYNTCDVLYDKQEVHFRDNSGLHKNIIEPQGYNFLMWSLLYNSFEIFKLFLYASGTDITYTDYHGNTILHHAIYHNRINALKELVQLYAIEKILYKENDNKVTPLMYAKHNPTINEILQNTVKRIEVHKKLVPLIKDNNYDQTRSMLAKDDVKKYIDFNAGADKLESNLLMIAIQHANDKMFNLLLKYPEKEKHITYVDIIGNTVLHRAVIHNKIHIIRTLSREPHIKHILNDKNGQGQTALYLAEYVYKNKELASFLRQLFPEIE